MGFDMGALRILAVVGLNDPDCGSRYDGYEAGAAVELGPAADFSAL